MPHAIIGGKAAGTVEEAARAIAGEFCPRVGVPAEAETGSPRPTSIFLRFFRKLFLFSWARRASKGVSDALVLTRQVKCDSRVIVKRAPGIPQPLSGLNGGHRVAVFPQDVHGADH